MTGIDWSAGAIAFGLAGAFVLLLVAVALCLPNDLATRIGNWIDGHESN